MCFPNNSDLRQTQDLCGDYRCRQRCCVLFVTWTGCRHDPAAFFCAAVARASMPVSGPAKRCDRTAVVPSTVPLSGGEGAQPRPFGRCAKGCGTPPPQHAVRESPPLHGAPDGCETDRGGRRAALPIEAAAGPDTPTSSPVAVILVTARLMPGSLPIERLARLATGGLPEFGGRQLPPV
jgi:hypothetical protein